MRHISKRWPGVLANDDVSLQVRRGEIHALVGENGAGKSTLMNILYGLLKSDSGEIVINGNAAKISGPRDAIALGIGMVHQHFMLIPVLSVGENIVLGREPVQNGFYDTAKADADIRELSHRYGLTIDPAARTGDLPVGLQQRVEILKVLYRGAKILILDEPTAVLVPQEVEELFGNLRDLKREGLTVIFISHKLDEVLSVADTITVIRRGTTVDTVQPGDVTARQLAELMVGSELPVPELRESTVTDVPVLTLRDVTVRDAAGRAIVDDVSLTIHEGEILGIAGVEGNGQAELVEAIMGMLPVDSGVISLGEADLTGVPTRRRREAGIGFIPEDRHRHGLLLESPLWENRILGHQTRPPNVKGVLIDRQGARRDTERIVREYDVRTPGIDVTAASLSGGNQQKLIVGREMSDAPKLLIAAHPTRGVDVGAQSAIWDHLRHARADGLAVLLISADLDELIGMSDTLRVILRGRLVGEADPATITPDQLGSLMTGAGEGSAA
jgi:general nucleoside transport system ATP-binding protein